MPTLIRLAILAALLPCTALAASADYAVQCTAACTAPDGTTQPAGTILNRVVADPAIFDPGPGLALIPDSGQALYAPPAPPPPDNPPATTDTGGGNAAASGAAQ